MIKFQAGTIHTSQVMDCQVHAIGKAISPLFTDLVTYNYGVACQLLGPHDTLPCVLIYSKDLVLQTKPSLPLKEYNFATC